MQRENLRFYINVLFLLGFCLPGTSQIVHLTEVETGKQAMHYLLPEFTSGTIIRTNGDSTKIKSNYNLITEEIVIDLGHSKAPYHLDGSEKLIMISDIRFIPIAGVLYEKLYEDAVTLLVHRKQKLERLGQNTGLGRSSIIDSKEQPPDKHLLYEMTLPGAFELKASDKYFLFKEHKLIPLDKLKDLYGIFPAFQEELKHYIKAERIKKHREEDLIRLARFINRKVQSN